MKRIGRPRKNVRKENISVNLHRSTIDAVNDVLGWNQSRSVWIEAAINKKLNQHTPTLAEASKAQLVHVLLQRDLPDWVRKTMEVYFGVITDYRKPEENQP